MSNTCLFVGRIPRSATDKDLEELFYKFGKLTRCEIKPGKGFGFVEFEENSSAEEALKEAAEMTLLGEKIAVEVASKKKTDEECFRCGKSGHWARDCGRRRSRSPYGGGGGRSGGRRGGRYSRSPPRYRDRYDDRDRSYRRRSRSPPPRYRDDRRDRGYGRRSRSPPRRD